MMISLANYGDCTGCCFGKICNKYLFSNPLTELVSALDRKRFIKKGECLYKIGEPVNHVMALRSGVVKLVNNQGGIQNLLMPGQLINGDSLYAGYHMSTAVATTDVSICTLEYNKLYCLGQITSEFTNYMFELLSLAVAQNQRMISVLTYKDMHSRVYAFLALLIVRLQDNGETPTLFQLPITLKEMASLLGSSTPTLSRVFTKLCEEGGMVFDKKTLEIKDINVLMPFIDALKVNPGSHS